MRQGLGSHSIRSLVALRFDTGRGTHTGQKIQHGGLSAAIGFTALGQRFACIYELCHP